MGKSDRRPNLATKIRLSTKRRGLLGTMRWACLKPWYGLIGKMWDWGHRVQTGRIVEVSELGVAGASRDHAIRYQPTPVGAFKRIIRDLRLPYEEWDFI